MITITRSKAKIMLWITTYRGFKIASVVVDFANMLLLLSINIGLGDELLVATCEKWWKSNLINRIYLLLSFFLLGQIFPFSHRKGYAWYRNEQIVLHIIIINLQNKSIKCSIYSTSIMVFLIKGFIDSRYQYLAFHHLLQHLFIFIEGKK